jgi:hypothetical protein
MRQIGHFSSMWMSTYTCLKDELAELLPCTQFTIEQNSMSSQLCMLDPNEDYAQYDLALFLIIWELLPSYNFNMLSTS